MRELNRRELLLKGTGAATAMTAAYALGPRPAATLLPGTAGASTGEPATPLWNHDPWFAHRSLSTGATSIPGSAPCGTGLNQSPVNILTPHA